MKKYILSLIVFLLTTSLFAQEYSDKQIGFDVERVTQRLKEKGVADDQLDEQISILRLSSIESYKVQEQGRKELDEKIEKDIFKKRLVGNPNQSRSTMTVPQVQKDALIALYNATNGPNWTNNTGWNTASDPSTWYGVTVDNNGNVIMLVLGQNNLFGSIPPEIGNLSFLKSLELEGNQIIGNIPASLFALQNLRILYLSSNNLTGQMPQNVNLPLLETFYLTSNQITGNIPASLFTLQNLKSLSLSGNSLTGQIPSIVNLPLLENLELQNNQISGNIPPSLFTLQNLRFLYLFDNNLSGQIPSIANLPLISNLWLNYNQISGNIPPSLFTLQNLKSLNLAENSLNGQIPSIANLPLLENLWLSNNQISGNIPPSLFTLQNLKVLWLEFNNISGEIPSSIVNLPLLQVLWLTGNQISGNIPPITTTNSNQRWLDLSKNKFRFNDFASSFNTLNTNFGTGSNTFNYFNQAKTDLVENLSTATGGTITFWMSNDPIPGSPVRYTPNDTFQWYKNGTIISGATARSYTIPIATALSAGVYTCKSTHPTITIPSNPQKNLILERNPITLTVTPAIPCITSSIGTLNTVSPNGRCATKAINYNLVLNTTSTAAVTYVWSIWNAAGTTQIGSNTTLTGTAAAGSSFSNTFATAGTYTVRVIATQAGCTAVTFNTTTIISANVTPTFTQVAAICTGSALAALPTTSNNGITGTWSPTLNNTATTLYTFTPTVGLCANIKTMSITVNQRVNPTFTQVTPICAGTTLAPLPTTSNNGITGTWSPALNNTATTLYTFTPTPGLCANTKTMTITIKPNVTPTFTQVTPKCAGTTLAALPTTSTNGVIGVWSPALNNLATTTYTFTPTAGSCVIGTGIVTMTITINPKVTPTFTQVTPRCSGSSLTGLLPTTSTNGITGVWSPALNNTTTTTYTFTPTAGSCVIGTGIVNMTITIIPKVTPTFTQVTPKCSGASLVGLLPTTSNNGITGVWSPALNNTTTTTYTFTPTAGSCVIGTGIVTMAITITPNTTPIFTQITPKCAGTALAALPTTSNNGITGIWSPALNNTTTTTYTFTPTAGLCANLASMTITITPNITPTFTQIAPICSGETLAALTTTSINGITGTWSPALNNTTTTTYTFTPSAGVCANTQTMTITVNPKVTPTFTQVASICSGETLSALPTTSINGITGTWSPALNNTTTTTYTFTPTAGLCATTQSMTITINPIVTPTFIQVEAINSGSILPALPTISTNGITGEWSPALNNTATTTYTFTPTTGLCAIIQVMTITVIANPTVTTLVCPEGFEGANFPPTGWAIFDNTPVNDIVDWIANTTTPYQGLKSAFMARHFVGQDVTSKDYLVTPAITIPNNGKLKFYGKSVLNGNTGTIYNIEIKLASTGSQTDISGFTTVQVYDEISMSQNYSEHTVDLSVFSGQSIYIAFVRQHTQNGPGISGDHWRIDNVRVVEGCPIATINLNSNALLTTYTSLNLTWTNPTSNLLQIEYGPQGYVPGTGTLLASSATSPYQLTGLPTASSLQFYYRFKCDSCEDLYSDWQFGGAYGTWNESFCPSPQLTVTNISSTSATVSWTPYGPATQWELVLQPIYSGVPSGMGIIVTQSPYVFTNLDPNTIYQCYIRSVCSPTLNGFWESAIVYNFNQTPCTVGNPNTPIIKDLFIDFINKLHTDYLNGVVIDSSYTSDEFTALIPYITDNNPAIYNFDGANFSFSFANHSGEINKDVLIPFPIGGASLTDFNCDFYNPEIYINDVPCTFSGNQQVSGKLYLKHIDFCKEITKPCDEIKGDIKIVSTEICTNSPLLFVFYTDSNVQLSYNWTFTHIDTGTQYTTNDYSPSITLAYMGNYDVELVVTDSLGCVSKFKYEFKIDKECAPCYKTNENSEYIKQKFIVLINHLNSYTTLPNGYTCLELDELINYLTDEDPAIYNFSNQSGYMKFSFANHSGYDVQIPITASTLLTNVELGNYTMPEMYANIVTYLSNETNSSKGYVKHINFCSDKKCDPVKGEIDIKIDKLCTATLLPFVLNTDYDTSLLNYNWSFNYFNPETEQYIELYNTGIDSVQEPLVILPYTGVYSVILTIIDENDCITIIRKKIEIIDDCKKCFEKKPEIAQNSKQAFINLINHLASTPPASINYGYTCAELSALSTYISDPLPAIYNFVNTGTSIKFSFLDHGVNIYDVILPITSGNPVSNIDLNDFVWEEIYANIKLFYSDGTAEMGLVKHINFCNNCKNFDGTIKIKNETQIVCQGIATEFYFESTSPIIQHNWSFYDASYNFIQSVSTQIANVLFQNNGTYHVSLEVTNNDNCKQTFYSTFVVATCPDTPIETDCKVHFNFNFKAPFVNKGGILTTPERLNIADGIINFVNSRIGEQLYLTTYDDHRNGVRRRVTQQLMIAPYPPAVNNPSNEIISGCLRIQDDYYTNTFKKIITNNYSPSNLGIVPHPSINDINVSFFIISQDRYNNLVELQNAYNQLLSPNKADKIFFVLVGEGKFKDTSTNTLIDPVDFVNSVKGSIAVDYNASSSFIDSDYIVYSKEQIADPSFVGQFSEFLNLAYKDIKPVNCDISCTVNNPHTPQVKDMFRDLLGYLYIQPIGSVDDDSTCSQLDLLRPYITDSNAKIWNFVKSNTSMSFSFANHPINEPDIFINLGTGDFGGIDLSNYVSSDTETLFKYNGNQTENNKVKHINFCPDELFCKHHVAIVVDESGSIDNIEALKIRKQLKAFVKKQKDDNLALGSNMHVSLIGMSDSDAYNRTDEVLVTGTSRILNTTNYDSWINNYGIRYNDTTLNGISPSSDYWKSGLEKALALNPKPDIVILITDGCQTTNAAQLKETIQKFRNNPGVGDPNGPQLHVIGIENGFYVDSDEASPRLSPEEDPNYSQTILTEENVENRVSPFLRKSLKYLMGYDNVDQVTTGAKFMSNDYSSLNSFKILGDDVNFVSNGLVYPAPEPNDPPISSELFVGCGVPIYLKNCDDCVGFQLERSKTYILSAWVKEEQNIQVKQYNSGKINIYFKDAGKVPIGFGGPDIIRPFPTPFSPKGDIIEGWQRIFETFTVPSEAVYFEIELDNISPGNPVYFDDIRIHPVDGSMKSFVYDPETFKLMSELDENNYSTYYEYDNEGGLIRIKKETERGIKTIQETRSGNVIKTSDRP